MLFRSIRELKAWQEVQKKVLKNCDYVLSYNGIPTSKHTLPRALEKIAELAGVHRIKIHALRHSHASLLISMGENPLLIKERRVSLPKRSVRLFSVSSVLFIRASN